MPWKYILTPAISGDVGTGCPELTQLWIFDCGLKDKDVTELVMGYPDLEYLGYKETGKVVKHLHAAKGSLLKLTHLNSLGTRSRKLIPQGLRFKSSLIAKAITVCPNVENLKVRLMCAHMLPVW